MACTPHVAHVKEQRQETVSTRKSWAWEGRKMLVHLTWILQIMSAHKLIRKYKNISGHGKEII